MATGDADDPVSLMGSIIEQQIRSQSAFKKLLLARESDLPARRIAHREFREATTSLLELELECNRRLRLPRYRSGPLKPWDIETLARPLVQQTIIEADVVEALGEGAEAARLRELAFRLADGQLSPGPRAQERRSMAAILASQGRFNEALTLLEDVEQVFVGLRDDVQRSQTALDRSVLLEWLGDHDRALAAITEAGSRVRSRLTGRATGWRDIAGAVNKEAASIFSGRGRTGESDEAAALWRISVELDEHEARIRKSFGEYDEAARLFEKVLREAYRSLGAAGPAIEYQLATIDAARGRYEPARDRLARIAPEFDGGPLRPRRAALRIVQADVQLGVELPSEALQLVQDGIEDLEKFPDFDLAWKLQWRRGRALDALGQPDLALDAYAEAAGIVDSLRKSPLGYRLDSKYLASKLPLFESAIGLAEARGAGAACARLIELIKARALSTVLSVPKDGGAARTGLELEYDRVTRRLDAIEYAGYREPGTVALADEHDELLEERVRLAEQIRLRDPRWRALTASAPFDPDALAIRLDERGQAALTLFVQGDRTVAVLLADGEVVVASQPLAPAVRTALEEYGRNLQTAVPDVFAHDFSAGPRHIGADAFVPRALLVRALEAESLFIAPHGNLHLLPWPALLFDGKRLFEHTAVGVLPNLTCLTSLDGDFPAAPRAALLGAPDYGKLPLLGDLPDAGAELEDLEKLYAGLHRLGAPPITGADATEDALRRLAEREDAEGDILHVACHGTLVVEEPMSSGLLLTDSKLDAGELAGLRIHYGEVVLSACSTGWRPETVGDVALTGDDVLGLPGALLEAGARAVVVSIPKADDRATRAFMTRYHALRASGQSPLRAHRNTQLALIKDKSLPPYTWVGIVCYAAR
ncbi:MAG: CHAT domain-containing protein [Deltaproteobacteria bacterium]|nr:MAG: CHAT domain-containing protein [Deltaproteobacteria bacterium]